MTPAPDWSAMEGGQALLQVCEQCTLLAPAGAVVKEPYVPYVPDAWNGVLVLAST